MEHKYIHDQDEFFQQSKIPRNELDQRKGAHHFADGLQAQPLQVNVRSMIQSM